METQEVADAVSHLIAQHVGTRPFHTNVNCIINNLGLK